MNIISFMNMKGGVGKTTSALNLSYGLAERNKKVILIDLDPQGNSSRSIIEGLPRFTIKELLENPNKDLFDQCLLTPHKYESGNISVIGATPTLFGTASKILADTSKIPQFRLKSVIKLIPEEYDYLIIDCAPTIDILSINAMLASDLVVVPTAPDNYSQAGLTQTLNNFNQLSTSFALPRKPMLLLTLMSRNNEQAQFAKELRERKDIDVFNTQIRFQAKPITAASLANDIVCRNKEWLETGVGQDYRNFINEVLEIFEPQMRAVS